MATHPTTFDELLARQEAGFATGSPPDLGLSVAPVRSALTADQLWALVERDIRYRLGRGLPVAAADYTAAFPELGDRVQAILAAAEQSATATYDLRTLSRADASVSASGGDRSATPDWQTRLKPGDPFGPYDVVAVLGRGGMGVVYQACHRTEGRPVALKVIGSALSKSNTALARFRREAKAAARLHHPNVVAALDAGEVEGVLYLALEFVPGTDLSTLVRTVGALPPATAVRHVLDAARGLAYAHERGVIHRDVKPSNLLLDSATGTVKVLDLGLARVETPPDEASRATELTSTGAMFGTVDYMPPEQARDAKRADARSDVYSLGCTLFYLLTGRVPYPADTLLQKLRLHREGAIPQLTEAVPGVPNRLDAAFRKMLARRPELRQQSMAEVIADLEQVEAVLGGREPDCAPTDPETTRSYEVGQATVAYTAPPGTRRRTALAGLVALLFVGVAAGVWAVVSSRPWSPSEIDHGTANALNNKQGDPPPAGPVGFLNREAPPWVEWDWPTGFPAPAVAPFSAEQARKHQEAWAAKVDKPVKEDGPAGLTLVLIPPGEFDRGCPGDVFGLAAPVDEWAAANIDHSRPVHRVRLTQPIQMGAQEITVAQFRQFVQETGHRTDAETNGKGGLGPAPDGPWRQALGKTWRLADAEPTSAVSYVTRRDAELFCAWLSAKGTGRFRLPSEAEWEFACRAGSPTRFGVTDAAEGVGDYAWADEWFSHPPDRRRTGPFPVGKKKANAFGLHDMLGNVWEMCADRFDARSYSDSPSDNPVRPGSWPTPVRGGSFFEGKASSNPAIRYASDTPAAHVGFRVVRELPYVPELDSSRPVLARTGEPLGARAMVSRPAPIKGLRSWSVEPVNPRSGYSSHLYSYLSHSPTSGLIAASAHSDPVIRIYDEELNFRKALAGHHGLHTSLAFSPNGRLLASGGWGSYWDNSIRIWEVETGRVLREHRIGRNGGYADWPQSVCWSPDGAELAVGCGAAGLHVIDARSGRVRSAPPLGHSSNVTWSPDGRYITITRETPGATKPDVLDVYQASDLRPLHTVNPPDGKKWHDLAWSPDGKWLAAAYGDDHRLALIDSNTFQLRPLCKVGHSHGDVLWTPDGKSVVVTGSQMTTWDAETGKLVGSPVPGTALMTWFKPGETLLAGRSDGLLEIRTVAGLPVKRSAERGRPAAVSAMLSPDGTELATAAGGDVRFWDAEDGRPKDVLKQAVPVSALIAWSPAGDRLVAWAAHGKSLTVFDRATGKQKVTCDGHTADIWNVAWSPDGKHLVSASNDKTARIWSATDGKAVGTLDAGEPVLDAVWSRKGDNLAIATAKEVRLYSADGKTLKRTQPNPKEFKAIQGQHGLSWSADDAHVTAPTYGGIVYVLDVRDGKVRSIGRLNDGLWGSQSWSPDGRFLALSADYQNGHVFDPATQTDQRFFPLRFAGWHPDGRRLVSGNGAELELYAYDTRAARRLGALLPLTGAGGLGVCVSPDGHFRGPAEAVVVVAQTENGEQATFTPEEFEQRYGWKNDPEKASFLKLPAEPPTPTTPPPGPVADRAKFTPLADPARKSVDIPPPKSPHVVRLSGDCLASDTPPIAGLQTWTVETVGHRGQVKTIAESPTGLLTATAAESGEVRIWDDGGRLQRILIGADGPVWVVAWSRDGRYLAAGGVDAVVRLWEVATGRLLRAVPTTPETGGLAWSPDGKHLLVAATKGWGLIDTVAGTYKEQQKGAFARASYADWSPDGSEYAVSVGSTIQIWGTRKSARVRDIAVPKDVTGANAVAWSPDGRRIAASCGPTAVRVGLWDATSGAFLGECRQGRFTGTIARLTWSRDGTRVLGGWGRGYAWDPETREIVATSPGSNGPVSLADDGRSGLFCDNPPALTRYALLSGAVRSATPSPAWPQSFGRSEIAPGGTALVTYPNAGLRRWRAATGQLEAQVSVPNWSGPVPSPGGDRVALYANDQFQVVRMATDASPLIADTSSGGVRQVTWSPDGRLIASAGNDRTVKLWDSATGKITTTLEGHTAPVDHLAWSPDGKLLASAAGGEDQSVRLWDTAAGKLLHALGKCPVLGLAWAPDSSGLAILRPPGEVVLADPATGRIGEPLVQNLNRPYTLGWADGRGCLAVGTSAGVVLVETVGGRRTVLPRVRLLSANPVGTLLLNDTGCTIRAYSVRERRRLGTLLPQFTNGGHAVISPDGHFTGSHDVEALLVYVGVFPDGRQEAYAPAAFRRLFGRDNDPARGRFTEPGTPVSPGRLP